MKLEMILTLAGGLAVLGVLAIVVLVKKRTAYLGPVKEELQKEKMWLRRGEYNAAMVKGRQNLELLLKLVAEKNGIQLDNSAQAVANAREEMERTSQNGRKHGGRGKTKRIMTHHEFNRWLAENGYLDRVAKWEMNQVRLIGNKAVHEGHDDKDDAWNQYNYLEDILKTVTEKSQNPKKHHERKHDAAPEGKEHDRNGSQKKAKKNDQNGGQKKAKKNDQNGGQKNDQNDGQKKKPKNEPKNTPAVMEKANETTGSEGTETPEKKKRRRRRKKSSAQKAAEGTAVSVQKEAAAADKKGSEAKAYKEKPQQSEASGEKAEKSGKRRRRRKPSKAQGEQLLQAETAQQTPGTAEPVKNGSEKEALKQSASVKTKTDKKAPVKQELGTHEPQENGAEPEKKNHRRRRRRRPKKQNDGQSAANSVVPEDKNEIV